MICHTSLLEKDDKLFLLAPVFLLFKFRHSSWRCEMFLAICGLTQKVLTRCIKAVTVLT